MPIRALSNLGNRWSGIAVSETNETVQSMVTQYATEVQPYYNSGNNKNIFVVWGGTNDIAAGRTAAQIKSNLETLCNSAKAQGYKVVIVGEIDRNWTSYVTMNAVRATLSTNMLLDFTNNVTSQVFLPASGITYADAYINLFGFVNFQSYLSAWYQADGIHPNTTGSNVVGDEVSSAINLI
jgi:lysophospholipase L1-like esterase